MSINYNLLVAAPILQDYFSDKDGTAMAGGTITCYQDNSRTTLKNWYYQSGTPGSYTYVRLPNPLTLSSAGTICDINGVDTIPFWYPYSEANESIFQPYYVTIVNKAGTNQITRANFPYVASTNINPVNATNLYQNLIINNGFWRNILPNTINNTPYKSYNLSNATTTGIVVAPSQHDGFRYPDIRFIKNNTSSTDGVIFTPFPLSNSQVQPGYISPEYYISHNCSVAGSNETLKCYQFPISLHLQTLVGVPYAVTIQAQNAGGTGTGQDVISLSIFQDTGTGTAPPAPVIIAGTSITLSSSWQTYTLTSIFPGTSSLSLGAGADDALYLQVSMPYNVLCTINFTKPSLYLNQVAVPVNDFQTYDQIDAIINSPRTGDIRSSLSALQPFGWVAMNDGTIGNVNSNATAYHNQDCFPLFNLIWTLFSNYNNSTTNLLAQMYNSAGSAVTYGATAIADWSANNAIALTKMMGQVILGGTVNPIGNVITGGYFAAFTMTSNLITITSPNTVTIFRGMPVYFTSTANISTTLIYYITSNSNFNGSTTFNISSSFANAMAGTIATFSNDAGTVHSLYQGSYEGEFAHTQLTGELASHSHTFSVFANNGSSLPPRQSDATTSIGTETTNTTGSSTPFNVTQPGVFMNMYIKL